MSTSPRPLAHRIRSIDVSDSPHFLLGISRRALPMPASRCLIPDT
jgi:hypothetical protein